MEIKVNVLGEDATLNDDGEWSCEDEGVKTILERIKFAQPDTPSVKHPLVVLAEWSMEVLGGKILSIEGEKPLRENVEY